MNDLKKLGTMQKQRVLSHLTVIKNGRQAGIIAIATAVLVISGCSITNRDKADEIDYVFVDDSQNEQFSKRVYGGIGIGASKLEPDTSQNSTYDVNDSTDSAGQVTIGADLTKTLSVELHSADLGTAGLSPSGGINYKISGGSALMYAGRNRQDRSGLSGYGRVGIGAMDNSAEGNVPFRRENDTQLLVGAGAEYGWRNGVGVRGEVIVFDKDAQFAQLGVIYRLGGDAELPVAVAQPLAPPPLPAPEPAITPIPAPSSAEMLEKPDVLTKYTADEDQDGIFDQRDDCPGSAPGVAIDTNGCAVFNGVIDGVNFERGSARLTDTARSILDNVIDTLSAYPDALVAIGAHTDSMGRDAANMKLSRDRAITVATYLINRGVPKNLMSARAYGELVPVADNQTSEGRARNRRVELIASKGIEQ